MANQEKWRIEASRGRVPGNGPVTIISAGVNRHGDGPARYVIKSDHGIDRDDARRLVAAVNACQGIPVEALENGVVGELLGAAKELVRQNDSEARPDINGALHQFRDAVAKVGGDDG